MNYKILGLVMIVLSLATPATIAQVTTLDYQGAVFTNVTTSGNFVFPDVPTLPFVVGDVVFSAPLAANLNDATLVPVAFNFNAPLLNNSFINGCCGSIASFAFSTNNAGAITGWNVDLSFTFIGTNSPSGNTVVLGPSGDTYTGFGSTPSGCGPPGGCFQLIQESNTTPGGWTVAQQAPEIDPASAASGLTLLLGGMAVLRGRRKLGWFKRRERLRAQIVRIFRREHQQPALAVAMDENEPESRLIFSSPPFAA
jgi:hypothetical protein